MVSVAFTMAIGVMVGVTVGFSVRAAVRVTAGVLFEQLKMHLSGLNDIQNGVWSGVLNWPLE